MTNTKKPILISREFDVNTQTIVTWEEYNALSIIAMSAARVIESGTDTPFLSKLRIQTLKENVERLEAIDNKIFNF
tara:strand:+ start:1346 stop:1573 length:228 start_codon:yes stop_codon:yes gene_type:complete